MNNNSPWKDVSATEWLDFWNSKIGQCLLKDMEDTKQTYLETAMKVADKTVDPNESISAFVNRAQGIQTLIDNIAARTELAKEEMKRRNKGGKDE